MCANPLHSPARIGIVPQHARPESPYMCGLFCRASSSCFAATMTHLNFELGTRTRKNGHTTGAERVKYVVLDSLNSTEPNLLAPVQTIFPELKIRAVVRGSRILMITAANRFGLYSAFLAWSAIFLRSNLQPRFTVQTMFLQRSQHAFLDSARHNSASIVCCFLSARLRIGRLWFPWARQSNNRQIQRTSAKLPFAVMPTVNGRRISYSNHKNSSDTHTLQNPKPDKTKVSL